MSLLKTNILLIGMIIVLVIVIVGMLILSQINKQSSSAGSFRQPTGFHFYNRTVLPVGTKFNLSDTSINYYYYVPFNPPTQDTILWSVQGYFAFGGVYGASVYLMKANGINYLSEHNVSVSSPALNNGTIGLFAGGAPYNNSIYQIETAPGEVCYTGTPFCNGGTAQLNGTTYLVFVINPPRGGGNSNYITTISITQPINVTYRQTLYNGT